MAEWFHAKSASVTVKDGRWDRTMIMVGYLSYGGEEEGERGGGGREGRRGGGWQVSLHQLQVRNQTNLNVVCTDKAYINTTNRS